MKKVKIKRIEIKYFKNMSYCSDDCCTGKGYELEYYNEKDEFIDSYDLRVENGVRGEGIRDLSDLIKELSTYELKDVIINDL